MPHFIHSETGMEIHRLLNLVDTSSGLHVKFCWRDLPAFEVEEKPLANTYEYVLRPLTKLLYRKNIAYCDTPYRSTEPKVPPSDT